MIYQNLRFKKRQIDWYKNQTSPTNDGGEIDDNETILDEN